MAGAEKPNNQKPGEANQSWRERFGIHILGGGMYSGGNMQKLSREWDVQKIRQAISSSLIE